MPGCCSSNQYAYMLEYRAEIALWALSGVLPLNHALRGLEWFEAAGGLGLSPGAASSRYFLSALWCAPIHDVSGWCCSYEARPPPGRSPYLLAARLHPLWR